MLQRLITHIEKWIETLQTVPVELLYPNRDTQLKLLNKLAGSTDLNDPIERSYCQYLAQKSLLPKHQHIVLNLIAIIATIPFIIISVFKHYMKVTPQKSIGNSSTKKRAVFYESTNEVLPESLIEEFNYFIREHGSALSLKDIGLIARMFLKHPLSFYFVLKITYKIAHYRYNYTVFQPQAVICCSEYSFTSSLMTHWCVREKIEHINVMHGEKLFHIVDSFAYFHRFYVWNQFYLDLIKSLLCSSNRFYIEIPLKFKSFQNLTLNTSKRTITCFLQTRDLPAWRNLAHHLEKLVSSYHINIRPHPRWLGKSDVAKIFGAFEIENPIEVNILESFRRTNCICSGYSTVLFLGHLAGREVIVDDISNPFLYNRLKELDFGVLQRPYKLLSELK